MTLRLPVCCMLVLFWLAATAPAAVPLDPVLQDFVIHELAHGGSGTVVLAALGGASGELVGGDAEGIRVRMGTGEGEMSLSWRQLGPPDLEGLVRPFIGHASHHVLASYLDLALSTGAWHGVDMDRWLAKLGTKDMATASRLSRRLAELRRTSGSGPGSPGAVADSQGLNRWFRGPLDGSGAIDRPAYERMARAGRYPDRDRALGPDAAYFHRDDGYGRDLPLIWQPPELIMKNGHNGAGSDYEVGGPPGRSAGDYSSDTGQVMYVPLDDGDPGVDRIQVLEEGWSVYSEKPQPVWWGGSHPEPALEQPSWHQAARGNIGFPIAMARAYDAWSNCAVMVFSSGLVGAAGTQTSQNHYPFIMLPPEKVPTAVALTSKNEFALVTIWDTRLLKGEVAVIALDSSGTDGLRKTFEWHAIHPCLANTGCFTTMKILGYVDLPFATPTAISVSGDYGSSWIQIDHRNTLASAVDLSRKDVRESFLSGANQHYCNQAGFAIVASRYQDRIAILDLDRLFAYVRHMYFTTAANYAKTLDVGPAPRQWPYAFSVEPRWRPTVVATATVRHPTSVLAKIVGGDHGAAYVGTVDGKLLIDDVTLDPGGGAASLVQVGTVAIGHNPTCLAYDKDLGWEHPPTAATEILACCRGDREIDWIRFSGNGGQVVRRLHDRRLIDPVGIETADTHGTTTHLVTVTDFKGRQVVNYRTSPVDFHTQHEVSVGVGPDGKGGIECGGIMKIPGYPFLETSTNVN